MFFFTTHLLIIVWRGLQLIVWALCSEAIYVLHRTADLSQQRRSMKASGYRSSGTVVVSHGKLVMAQISRLQMNRKSLWKSWDFIHSGVKVSFVKCPKTWTNQSDTCSFLRFTRNTLKFLRSRSVKLMFNQDMKAVVLASPSGTLCHCLLAKTVNSVGHSPVKRTHFRVN